MSNAGEFQIEKYIRNYGLVSVRALEPCYSEEELILDIKGTVQQRTKFMSGLPDRRAFMENISWK